MKKSSKVLFSIIVPVYNSENYINRCIRSICEQTIHNFELIIIDDGSTDNSGAMCDEFSKKDDRIRVMHKKNGGVSSARNIGIDLAIGEFIVFIDSDDYVDPDYLDSFKIEKEDDIVISGYIVEDENNQEIIEKKLSKQILKTDEDVLNAFVDGRFNYACIKAIRKAIIVNYDIRYNEEINLSEDTLFMVEILKSKPKVRLSDKVGYHYVKYSHQTLTTGDPFVVLFQKLENANDLIYNELSKIYGHKVDFYVARRIGILYKVFLLEIISEKNVKKEKLKYLYSLRWFKKSLADVDYLYADDDKKFKWILKTKKWYLVFWFEIIKRKLRGN